MYLPLCADTQTDAGTHLQTGTHQSVTSQACIGSPILLFAKGTILVAGC